MDAIQLDQLPDLCLRKIFALLSLRDRLRCRAVNRQFKYYADQTACDELVVSDSSTWCGDLSARCNVWYLTGRAIDRGNSISRNALSSARSSSLKLDQRLKFLHVHPKDAADFDFKTLNAFKQLVHLEIRLAAKDNSRKKLVLPNLKVLNVQHYEQHSYVLKTPKLEVLACREIERIQVKHPEKLKRLACDYPGVNHLAKFENLEVLTLLCIGYDLNPISLSDWKRLKELDLSIIIEWLDTRRYEQFKSSLVNLMHQRAALKRDVLKLYLNDVLLVDESQLVDYKTMARPDLFLFKNYQRLRLDSYPDVLDVDFTRLMQLDVELSTDFFDRFPEIESLEATGPVDRDNFEWFLENSTALYNLTLVNISLNNLQAFLNGLPNIISRLTRLEMNGSSGQVTDFNFILRFEQLGFFETHHQFDSLELPAQAFRQLKDLSGFLFRSGNECVEIWRFTPGKEEYNLSFWTISEFDNKAVSQTLGRKKLQWTELATLYDQRRAELATQRVGARINRAR